MGNKFALPTHGKRLTSIHIIAEVEQEIQSLHEERFGK